MQTVLLIGSGIISAYVFILVFRVILSWFVGDGFGGFWNVLCAITDPWLSIFRRVRFLRRGALDLTPILAILVLQLISLLLRYFAIARTISAVTILAMVGLALWNTVFSILLFFAIVAVARLATILFAKRPPVQFVSVLDTLLSPFVLLVTRIIPRGRDLSYTAALVILLVILAIICLSGLFFLEPLLYSLLFV